VVSIFHCAKKTSLDRWIMFDDFVLEAVPYCGMKFSGKDQLASEVPNDIL